MKKLLVFCKLVCIILVNYISASGQDVRFSQFYSAPQSLNPALTGLFQGDHRFIGNYRSQWKQANADFITTAFAYDTDVLSNLTENDDVIGAGVMVFNDKAGYKSGINTFNVAVSGSYHLPVGENGKLAMGLQANVVQKSTFGGYTFPNNWDPDGGFDNNIGGDNITKGSITNLDVNTGIFYYSFIGGGESSVFFGVSSFHLIAHKESFIPAIGNSIGRRIVAHGGTRLTTDKDINFVPNFLYMKQGKADELNLGFSVEFELPDIKSVLAIGFWTRTTDAIIPTIAFDFQNFHIGLSYDMNFSELQASTNRRGGFELSLTYILNNNINHNMRGEPCPRF